MDKMLKKIIGIVLVFSCIIAIGYTSIVVNAEDKETAPKEEKVEKPEGQCNEITAEGKYSPNVENNYASKYLEASISAGSFNVLFYQLTDTDDAEIPVLISSTILDDNNQKSAQFKYDNSSASLTYEVVFVLNQTDDTCSANTGNVTRSNDGIWSSDSANAYVYFERVEISQDITETLITNSNYNTICAAFRTGNWAAYASQFEKAGLSESDFNQYGPHVVGAAAYQSRLEYCYSPLVEMDFKESEAAMMIRNAVASYKISQLGQTGSLQGPPNSEGLITLAPEASTDLTSTPLQCPAYQNVNGIQVPNTSNTVKSFYKTVTTVTPIDIYESTSGTDGTCSKTCEETVTVTYGPPVASKAGLCFEYKVKVESKLNCVTEFQGEEPKLSDYNVCTPVPACTHASGSIGTQAGPSEDFDQCINECDGGKYSQSCINKCYKQVYEKNTSLLLNYEDKLYAEQIAAYNKVKAEQLATDEEMAEYLEILSTEHLPTTYEAAEKLKKAVIEAGSSYYTVYNDNIIWNVGSNRFWDRAGRYYTVVTPYPTIRDINRQTGFNSFLGTTSRYAITRDGFKRANWISSYCNVHCKWTKCNQARQNGYYKGYPENPGTATNREFLNYSDAADVYNADWERYENAVKECKAAASCTSKTSEFTIKVNNKTNSEPEVDNWIEYNTSISESGTLNGTTVNGNALSGTSIILDRSGCYGETPATGEVTYMTEWSFPGTWINNKTGKISYQPQSGNAWHLKTEKFCTNLDSKYVNKKWWNQRILQPNTNVAEEDKVTNFEYNIVALAKDFGYFGWDLKVDCFYALYDYPAPGEPGDPGIPEDGAISYKARTVDLADIFPNNDDESTTNNPNEAGREPGYNWTDGATNIKNELYEITPGALYPMIQSRGTSIYDESNNDMYLDYEFYLTPSDLSKIRKYSSQDANGNYSNYPGKIKVSNGIAYYESALFRNSSTSTYKLNQDSIITLGALGVNNQKNKNSNEAETFSNPYTAALKQSRYEYLNILGGTE